MRRRRLRESERRTCVPSTNYYVRKATEAESEGQTEEAIGYVQLALDIDPKKGQLWALLGTFQEDLQNREAAMASFNRALELGHDVAAVHAGIGRCARDLGNFEEAERTCLKRVELDPSASGYIMLGDMQRRLDRDADAEESFREALKLDPDNEEAMLNLAIQLRSRKRADEAIPWLRRAIQIDPDYAHAYEELGVSLRVDGAWEEAERMLRHALHLDESRVWAHLYLGEVLEKLEDVNAAERHYVRAAELDPGLYLPHKFLGKLCESQGRMSEAKEHLRRAAELEDETN